jgi:stage II sporulation protein AA (anti-sigma F factor antagonist)
MQGRAREPSGSRAMIARTPSPTITVAGDTLTAVIAGEFDMRATFAAEPALERAMQTPGLRHVTLDLSGLTFIDSLGLGVVLRLASELDARGIAMRILPGPPPVQRVFATAGMAHTWPFAPEQPQ